jgi:hypothetical protein
MFINNELLKIMNISRRMGDSPPRVSSHSTETRVSAHDALPIVTHVSPGIEKVTRPASFDKLRMPRACRGAGLDLEREPAGQSAHRAMAQRRLGPFNVGRELAVLDRARLFDGMDPVLRRSVWLVEWSDGSLAGVRLATAGTGIKHRKARPCQAGTQPGRSYTAG